jgi:hypothetical protein
MEYQTVTQKVLFGNNVLTAAMSGRKHDAIPQNGDCSNKSNARTFVFRNKVHYQNATLLQNSLPSENAISRWLEKFQEPGNVLHQNGEEKPSTSQEYVDQIQQAFFQGPQNSTGQASL